MAIIKQAPSPRKTEAAGSDEGKTSENEKAEAPGRNNYGSVPGLLLGNNSWPLLRSNALGEG